jgi:hypothetical protein
MRDGALPAVVIALAVIAYMGYLSFQGASHAVTFAVTGSDVAVVPAQGPAVPQRWQRRAGSGQVLLVDVSWTANEAIGAGSYAVMVTTPAGWRHLGCRPECEWSGGEGLREFGRQLPQQPYPLAATFEAEETGVVRVAFRSPRGSSGTGGAGSVPSDYVPIAWLVQTNGDDVLGAEQVPLT